MKLGTLEIVYCKYNKVIDSINLKEFQNDLWSILSTYTMFYIGANFSAIKITEVFANMDESLFNESIAIRNNMHTVLSDSWCLLTASAIIISLIITLLKEISKGEFSFNNFLKNNIGVAVVTVLNASLVYITNMIFLG